MSGTYAYIANNSGGLRVLDISDPSAPTEVGAYSYPGASRIHVSGQYAYLIEPTWPPITLPDLHILDISNPLALEEIGSYAAPLVASSIYVLGSQAFLTERWGFDDGSLHIIDVSNPSQPLLMAQFTDVGGRNGYADVFVSGPYAYAAVGDQGGFHIIDVSNPSTPTGVSFFDMPFKTHAVHVWGGHAFVTGSSEGLRIVDVSDPSVPTEVGVQDTPGYAEDVFVAGDIAYVADYDAGLSMIGVASPGAPATLGAIDWPSRAEGLDVKNGYAYVADGTTGLTIVNVSNPHEPRIAGSYDTPGWVHDVEVIGGYAYVCDYDAGLRVLDVSDPAAPVEVGVLDTPDRAWEIHYDGTYLYLADGTSGLHIIDISNPTSPTEIGLFDNASLISVIGVHVVGSYAYVLAQGLHIVDVSTPSSPTEVGSFDSPAGPFAAESVFVDGSFAYLAEKDEGLRVLDVSDPSVPTEVGQYQTPGIAGDVAVAGGIVFVADGSLGGMQVFDASDPNSLTLIGAYDTRGGAAKVDLDSNYVYIADGNSGLTILQLVLQTFMDVPPAHWAWPYVEAIAAAGLTAGYPDGTYRPDNSVTRAEMAVFLKKGIHGSGYFPPAPNGSHPFSDLAGHWAEWWMEDLYDEGLTAGYPEPGGGFTYRPENQVTRGEMAVFLLKAKYGSSYFAPAPAGGSFSDVAGHWAESWIEQLKEEGITSGYPDGTFRPENPVTRAEMAVFLVQTFNLPLP